MAGPILYQIDRSYEPKSGPLTIACDGEHVWRVFADKVTKGPAGPPPSDVRAPRTRRGCSGAGSRAVRRCWPVTGPRTGLTSSSGATTRRSP